MFIYHLITSEVEAIGHLRKAGGKKGIYKYLPLNSKKKYQANLFWIQALLNEVAKLTDVISIGLRTNQVFGLSIFRLCKCEVQTCTKMRKSHDYTRRPNNFCLKRSSNLADFWVAVFLCHPWGQDLNCNAGLDVKTIQNGLYFETRALQLFARFDVDAWFKNASLSGSKYINGVLESLSGVVIKLQAFFFGLKSVVRRGISPLLCWWQRQTMYPIHLIFLGNTTMTCRVYTIDFTLYLLLFLHSTLLFEEREEIIVLGTLHLRFIFPLLDQGSPSGSFSFGPEQDVATNGVYVFQYFWFLIYASSLILHPGERLYFPTTDFFFSPRPRFF